MRLERPWICTNEYNYRENEWERAVKERSYAADKVRLWLTVDQTRTGG